MPNRSSTGARLIGTERSPSATESPWRLYRCITSDVNRARETVRLPPRAARIRSFPSYTPGGDIDPRPNVLPNRACRPGSRADSPTATRYWARAAAFSASMARTATAPVAGRDLRVARDRRRVRSCRCGRRSAPGGDTQSTTRSTSRPRRISGDDGLPRKAVFRRRPPRPGRASDPTRRRRGGASRGAARG